MGSRLKQIGKQKQTQKLLFCFCINHTVYIINFISTTTLYLFLKGQIFIYCLFDFSIFTYSFGVRTRQFLDVSPLNGRVPNSIYNWTETPTISECVSVMITLRPHHFHMLL